MKCCWLIQKNCFDEHHVERLIDNINRSGALVKSFEYRIGKYDEVDNFKIDPEMIYFIYGSVQFSQRFSKLKHSPFPGRIFNENNFKKSSYLTFWGDWCLNDDAIFTTWGNFKRRKDYFFSLFNDTVFLRPNSYQKVFTGLSIKKSDWKIESNSLDQLTSIMDDTLIAVCHDKKIIGEWRFFISEGKILTASQYRWSDSDQKIDVPNNAYELVEQIINHSWQPEIAYVVDICWNEEKTCKIIEVNGINSSGLYDSNLEQFVNGINQLITNEWRKIHDNTWIE